MTLEPFEGPWEKVQTHIPEFVGHRVRVTVLDNTFMEPSVQPGIPERHKRRQAFEEFCQGSDDFADTPLLTPEDLDRETLYGLR